VKALVFCLLLVFFSGCSSDSHSSKSTKTFRIARDPSWYPLVLPGLEASILGFTDDLLNNIAKEKNLDIQLVYASWDALSLGLKSDRYEVIVTSMPEVLANVQNYSFSDLYLPLGPVLVVPKDSLKTKLEDFQGLEAGVLEGSVQEMQILEKIPSINIHTYMNYPLLLEDLVMGNIDVILMPSLIANTYVRDLYGDDLKVLSKPLTNEGLKVATLFEEHEEFLKKFDEGLKTLIEKDVYDQLLKKWKLK
jgi:polar amino acid transport system substrate-binding protein